MPGRSSLAPAGTAAAILANDRRDRCVPGSVVGGRSAAGTPPASDMENDQALTSHWWSLSLVTVEEVLNDQGGHQLVR
jgi:hypothetical protein